MKEQASQNDLISAFLDEELAENEIDALLAQLECPDHRQRACRHWLVDSALRQRQAVSVDVSAGVRDVIASEAPLAAASTSRVVSIQSKRGWRGRVDWKIPAGGLAVAASAALVAVMVVKPAAESGSNDLSSPQPLSVAQQSAPAAAPVVTSPQAPARLVSAGQSAQPGAGPRELVIAAPAQPRQVVAQWGRANTDARTVSSPAALREQLNAYLLNHARSGGGTALSGSLGYARMAASPQQQRAESSR